jgi:hypothetical protein
VDASDCCQHFALGLASSSETDDVGKEQRDLWRIVSSKGVMEEMWTTQSLPWRLHSMVSPTRLSTTTAASVSTRPTLTLQRMRVVQPPRRLLRRTRHFRNVPSSMKSVFRKEVLPSWAITSLVAPHSACTMVPCRCSD